MKRSCEFLQILFVRAKRVNPTMSASPIQQNTQHAGTVPACRCHLCRTCETRSRSGSPTGNVPTATCLVSRRVHMWAATGPRHARTMATQSKMATQTESTRCLDERVAAATPGFAISSPGSPVSVSAEDCNLNPLPIAKLVLFYKGQPLTGRSRPWTRGRPRREASNPKGG